MTPIHRIAQIFAPVRKPYQAEQLNALPANERKKVFGAEADLFLQMLALAAYASHTQEAHARDIIFEDKDLIDSPLAAERTLIQCYVDTGLAQGEYAAKLMVQRLKTSAKEQIQAAPEITGR